MQSKKLNNINLKIEYIHLDKNISCFRELNPIGKDNT